MTPDPRNLIRNDITILGAAVVRRPVIRGDPASGTKAEPEPLAGIRAATALGHAVSRVKADCARYAREDGVTWEQIGEALGFKPGPDLPPVGESAFRVLASDLGRGPSFAWTCMACGQTVIDYGPEAGHLSEQETGHAEGCERFAADLEAWQWGDGSDDG